MTPPCSGWPFFLLLGTGAETEKSTFSSTYYSIVKPLSDVGKTCSNISLTNKSECEPTNFGTRVQCGLLGEWMATIIPNRARFTSMSFRPLLKVATLPNDLWSLVSWRDQAVHTQTDLEAENRIHIHMAVHPWLSRNASRGYLQFMTFEAK